MDINKFLINEKLLICYCINGLSLKYLNLVYTTFFGLI